MICAYKLVKGLIQFVEDEEAEKPKKDPISFFLKSMSDETYLDMIREHIMFLIDEGYKYSEQLEIITRESGRDIKYSTYTNFVKLFILEKPDNIFQNREFQRHYTGFNGQSQNSKDNFENKVSEKIENIEKPVSKPKKVNRIQSDFLASEKVEENFVSKESSNLSDSTTVKGSVAPLKKRKKDISVERKNISFQHQAMPDVDELY